MHPFPHHRNDRVDSWCLRIIVAWLFIAVALYCLAMRTYRQPFDWSQWPTTPPEVMRANWLSHLGQDAWVAAIHGDKRGGTFLDVGAYDGVTHSNTAVLERELGWRGWCVEPHPWQYARLCRNRSAICLPFAATWLDCPQELTMTDNDGLSAIVPALDGHFPVHAWSIDEMLERWHVPDIAVIEYLSLDVEGHELEALRGMRDTLPRVQSATIEHGCDPDRRRVIIELMRDAGFDVVRQDVRHDDFFWRPRGIADGIDPQAVWERIDATLFPPG